MKRKFLFYYHKKKIEFFVFEITLRRNKIFIYQPQRVKPGKLSALERKFQKSSVSTPQRKETAETMRGHSVKLPKVPELPLILDV